METVDCSECDGLGEVVETMFDDSYTVCCQECKGSGIIEREVASE